MAETKRPQLSRGSAAWRFGVPLVCLLAGVLLAATHGVSGGDEIRRSDAPRLVDLVREAQQSVDRLSAQRDGLVAEIDNHHGGSPGADAALAAIQNRNSMLAADAGFDPSAAPASSSRSPTRSATPTAGSLATRPRMTWWCISRTSRRCSTRCGAAAPRASRCRISGSSVRPRRAVSATPFF